MSFTQFKLHKSIETGIEALGYAAPTPIQLQSMPAILQGKDVMVLAHEAVCPAELVGVVGVVAVVVVVAAQ